MTMGDTETAEQHADERRTVPEYHILDRALNTAEEWEQIKQWVKLHCGQWVKLHRGSTADVRAGCVVVIDDAGVNDGPTVTFDLYVKRDGKHVWNDAHTGVLITTVTVPLVAPWPLAAAAAAP